MSSEIQKAKATRYVSDFLVFNNVRMLGKEVVPKLHAMGNNLQSAKRMAQSVFE